MNIVIIGAAGGTGRCLVERALNQGHQVTAAVRTPQAQTVRHDRLHTVQCDVRDPNAVHAALRGQDVVLCALGGPRKGVTVYSDGARAIVRAMHTHRIRRLVFLSNYGVLSEQGSGVITRALLGLARRALKDTLDDHRMALDLIRNSGLEWVAVRPMVLTNGAGKGRYRVSSDGLPPNASHIARADVAHFMLDAAVSNDFLEKAPAIGY